MNLKASHSRRIPISIWEEERPLKIPIRHQSPGRPVLGRWVKPLGRQRPGTNLIIALQTPLVSPISEWVSGARYE
jgi:hypothetical protein